MIDYSFYIWSRCDWIWILNGYGMLDREITLHSTRPLPLIEKEKYETQVEDIDDASESN